MARVRKAYNAEVKAAGRQPGSAVPIKPVIERVLRDDRKLRRDSFLAALTQLIREGRTAIDGYEMDLQQIKSASDGVLLPGLEDRGLVGYIKFSRRQG